MEIKFESHSFIQQYILILVFKTIVQNKLIIFKT